MSSEKVVIGEYFFGRGPHDPEELELWLVIELKRGRVINLNHSGTGNASVAAESSAISGVPVHGGVTAKSSTTGELSVTAGSPILPFAFKAIRLLYGNDGKLIRLKKDMGKHRPKKRAGESSEFEADKNPEFHMGGLFYRASEVEGISSEEGEVHENGMECLRFVGVKE
jgi:hypothetical protein